MSNQVAIARAIAHLAHKGQVDKAGNAYIGHPERVVGYLQERGEEERVIAAGWLHDVLEDTDLTRDDLHAAGIYWNIINLVEMVTRSPGVRIEDYYAVISQSPTARRLKEADIQDNSHPERLALLDEATVVRLTRKYAKALRHIRGDVTHD